MLKTFNISLPTHSFGRCFRYDYPISGNDDYVVGAFATVRTESIICGKVAISTDNGEVIHPSLSFCQTPLHGVANKMMQPVDFVRVGNKLTIIIEEDLTSGSGSYDISVFIKTRKRGR